MTSNKKDFMCACNNRPCSGECRDKNLYRNRQPGEKNGELNPPCPAAFRPQVKKVYRQQDDND